MALYFQCISYENFSDLIVTCIENTIAVSWVSLLEDKIEWVKIRMQLY